jgi:hypothetical protein
MNPTGFTCFRRLLLTVCAVVMVWSGVAASGQDNHAPARAPTISEVVNQLVEHNQDRANRLRYYTSQRHYHLEYHGFPHSADAAMDVEAIYSAPSKSFRVLSESGSPKLINHVLKKLLKGEQDAASEQRRNALTPENYNFALLETAIEDGRCLFVLQVDPKTPSKFLFSGKIWIDAEDYAVKRVEAEPSQNLSFWIRNTEIRHVYSKVGEFWLPKQNTTVTKVRLGGIATLTIDFDKYEFQVAQSEPAFCATPLAPLTSCDCYSNRIFAIMSLSSCFNMQQ